MDTRAIGVFDSGVGGLSAVRALRALLPGEDILFLADTANVPYGTRSREDICALSAAGARILYGRGVKALLAACGTISANGLGAIAGAVPIPFCGVIEPAAAEAARVSRNRRVGVLSTEATARTGAIPRAIRAHGANIEVFAHGAGALVPLAEAGRTDYADPEVRAAVDASLAPFAGTGIDTLVLGCTHFPLLSGAISGAVGAGVRLVDSGYAGARECVHMLAENELLSRRASGGRLTCLVSGDTQAFAKAAAAFLPGGLEGVSIEKT